MSIDLLERPAGPAAGDVGLSAGLIRIRDEAAFGPGRGELCARFLGRAFAIEEVRSVTIDRASGTALVRHGAGPGALPGLLSRLAASIRGLDEPLATRQVPTIPGGLGSVTVRRHGAILTTSEVLVDEPGRLQLGHPSLKGNRALARRVVSGLRAAPGVLGVRAEIGTGRVVIRTDASTRPAPRLIRLADAILGPSRPRPRPPAPLPSTRMGMSNVSLGVAAAGQFLFPVLLPVSAALLIWTNLKVIKAAWHQVRGGRLGLAVLYLAIATTTLATGRFLASALMSWTFHYWHRRFRHELASERARLLGPIDEEWPMARLATEGGTEILVAADRLRPGDLVAVSSGEPVPVDGRVVRGEGVVDERSVRGPEGIARRSPGDFVRAGSKVLAGSIEVEVTEVGDRTRAASIRRALVASTDPAPGHLAPTERSETFASKAVGPTLATAGVGLLAGDLTAVGAILRPDYATGPGMAIPLETLRLVTLLARRGVVVRDPGALERLAEVRLIVLDDHPSLSRRELEVTRVEARLSESVVLQYAASAFRHLVDDRSAALADACRGRRIHLLDLEPVDLARGVAVDHGGHRVRVFEADPSAEDGPLCVEVDGASAGSVEFGRSARLEVASTMARVRRESPTPVAFVLASSRGEAEASALARSMGVDLHLGGFSDESTAEFLRGCRDRGIRAAFMGDCRERPRSAEQAHVALSIVGEADLEADPAGLLMLRDRPGPLADLREFSAAHVGRARQAERFVLVPNLLCVAGAFLFGFSSMTAVVLSNIGTLGLYRRASDSLQRLDAHGHRRPASRHRAG